MSKHLVVRKPQDIGWVFLSLMTFNIWSDKTKKVLQRSAIRTADPNRGAIPNERVIFGDDVVDVEPEIVDTVDNDLNNDSTNSPPTPTPSP